MQTQRRLNSKPVSAEQMEISRLRAELAHVQMERDILGNATANGLPSKPTHDLDYGKSKPGASSTCLPKFGRSGHKIKITAT